jgi:hypothetical protein
MSFDYEERPSSSRFVDIIWRTYDTSDGTYLAAADACWDMIFIRSVHGNRALLSGPSTEITPVPYRAGNTAGQGRKSHRRGGAAPAADRPPRWRIGRRSGGDQREVAVGEA